ncbi:MAG TPA: substrate-binding domain-containing protein [Verrucomicrobiota bacterium]|nr:substrate-binding domain-containing protein [Verrucomicrobiota bacterium]HNU52900.1 substrate-binding domain-containing protein [Verrucomicrobiota bacterium]
MTRIPQRVSLVAQAVAILREDIRSGYWTRGLPGEHSLCSHLQVSRVTLRAALAQLQREGLIRSRQGQRREIVPGTVVGREAGTRNLVVLLTPVALEVMQRFALFWIDDLRQTLVGAGYEMEVHRCRACTTARPELVLEGLAQRLRPAGWVLYQFGLRVQRWFSEHALPCVVAGSCHPGVRLPSVDVDYRAVCRHACGLFLARGHRQVAFLKVDTGLAGDEASEEGFLEGARGTRGPAIEAVIARHDGSIKDICRQLSALLGRARRPTGLLVAKPENVLTVLGCLSRRGMRVPQDISVISRDDDPLLDHVLPTVARYSADSAAMARKVSKWVVSTVQTGVIRPREDRLMPQFVPGESLSACP